MQAQTPTVVAREAPCGGVRLVFCERGYPSLSIWCYCFLQLPTKDALVPALIWVLSAGRYPLHHSICLPLTKATWQKLQIFKIQYGGRPPFLKSLNLHISVKKRPILMKFGTLQQILNLMTVTWPKIEILKIQDGGRRHLEFLKFQFLDDWSSLFLVITHQPIVRFQRNFVWGSRMHVDRGYMTKTANF